MKTKEPRFKRIIKKFLSSKIKAAKKKGTRLKRNLKQIFKTGGNTRLIKTAAKNNHVVKITYTRKKDNQTRKYNIEAYSERGNGLLYGYKRNSAGSGTGIRAFKKSRIERVEVLSTKFEPKYQVEF